MALFRHHRGSLSESLKTTIIVSDIQMLFKHICYYHEYGNRHVEEIKIEKYETGSIKDSCFDERIGWYTHIVLVKIAGLDPYPAGFLSEPLQLSSSEFVYEYPLNFGKA